MYSSQVSIPNRVVKNKDALNQAGVDFSQDVKTDPKAILRLSLLHIKSTLSVKLHMSSIYVHRYLKWLDDIDFFFGFNSQKNINK